MERVKGHRVAQISKIVARILGFFTSYIVGAKLGVSFQSSAFSYQLKTKMREQKFRKLEVWNKAMIFIEKVYKVTNGFPSHEMYGLTSQLKRAAISIALNIAEGSGADSDTEFNRFLTMSLRSSYEVMCGLEVATKLLYCPKEASDMLIIRCEELSAMLTGLKKRLKADS